MLTFICTYITLFCKFIFIATKNVWIKTPTFLAHSKQFLVCTEIKGTLFNENAIFYEIPGIAFAYFIRGRPFDPLSLARSSDYKYMKVI